MLCRCFVEKGLDIALIQEPWIFRQRIRGLPERIATLYYVKSESRPRSCILVRHGVQAVLLPQLCTPDLVVVRVGSGAGTFVLASGYLPYDSLEPPPGGGVEALVKYCREKNADLVLGCDANAHSTVWGSTNDNRRGEDLLEFAVSHNLAFLNRGTEPTFVDARRKEVIDVTLCSARLLERVVNWKVADVVTLSDHRAITFDIRYGTRGERRGKWIRIPKNTDRIKYQAVLREKLETSTPRIPKNTIQVESQLRVLQEAVEEAYRKSCTPTEVEELSPTPWWGRELESLKKEVRKAFNHALRGNDPEAWIRYKSLKRTMKKTLRQKKRESWRDFCSGTRNLSDVCRLQKMVSNDPISRLGLVRDKTGTMTETWDQTIEVLMEAHFPGSFKSDMPWPIKKQGAYGVDRAEAERIVTLEGVRRSIESFDPFKSAGLDGIFPALLQWGTEILAPRLRGIYIACLAIGYIPVSWRETKVIFLPKPGKKDYTEAKSFRPVSLTSSLLKTMERIMAYHIEKTTLKEYPLSSNQHAYCSGKSTETALHQVVRVAEEELNTGGIAMTTIMDIEGAFDRIHFGKLEAALSRRRVNPLVRKWIGNMLKLRAVNIQKGESKLRGRVSRGCPQGGVLSPILWNITVDSLLRRLDDMGIHNVGYADDIAIMTRGKFMNITADKMRSALRVMQRWCEEQELYINAGKSDLIIFTRKRKNLDIRPLELFGTELKVSGTVKYLGVILDSRLTWKKHIEEKVQKAVRALHQCGRVCGRRWGISPKSAYWIYTMMVRPIISYASVIWWEKASQNTVVRQLSRVQRLACMGITGAFRTTPTRAMELMLGLLPLDLYVKKVAAATSLRMDRNANWHRSGTIHGHRKILDIIKHLIPDLKMPMDGIGKVRVIERYHETLITDGSLPESRVMDITIFTDGSRIDEKAGAGVYSEDLDLECHLSLGKHTSVYQAEMLALMVALDHLEVSQVMGKDVLIALDNQAVIKCMEQTEFNSSLALECVLKLNACASKNKLTLAWVKGHVGIRGNERADVLAKRGAALSFHGPEPYVALGKGKVKGLIEEWAIKEHWRQWSIVETCRQAKMTLGTSCSAARWRSILYLDRKTLRWLTALLTGHGNFRYHLNKMGLSEEDICRLCLEEQETAAHILCQCPAIARKRFELSGHHWIETSEINGMSHRQMLALTQGIDVRMENWRNPEYPR